MVAGLPPLLEPLSLFPGTLATYRCYGNAGPTAVVRLALLVAATLGLWLTFVL